MSTTDDMTDDLHAKMKLATSAEIWAPGGPVTDWTTDYDIRNDDYIEDPVPIWAEMREKCPVAHTDRLGGSWNPTRFDDLRALAKMIPELSSRQVLVMPPAPNAPEMSRYEQMIAAAPITADPPIHTWTRRMLLPAFAPRAVEAHREFTERPVPLAHRRLHRGRRMRRCRRLLPTDPAARDRPPHRDRPGDGRPVRRLGQRAARRGHQRPGDADARRATRC